MDIITKIQFNNILKIHGFDRYLNESAKTELIKWQLRLSLLTGL